MRILRGTFRLSVVVAVLVAAYSAFITYQKSADYRAQQLREYFDVKFAYQCAARQTDENLRQFVNDYGLIDLIKAGCTEQKMVASFDELKQWRMERRVGTSPMNATCPRYLTVMRRS